MDKIAIFHLSYGRTVRTAVDDNAMTAQTISTVTPEVEFRDPKRLTERRLLNAKESPVLSERCVLYSKD